MRHAASVGLAIDGRSRSIAGWEETRDAAVEADGAVGVLGSAVALTGLVVAACSSDTTGTRAVDAGDDASPARDATTPVEGARPAADAAPGRARTARPVTPPSRTPPRRRARTPTPAPSVRPRSRRVRERLHRSADGRGLLRRLGDCTGQAAGTACAAGETCLAASAAEPTATPAPDLGRARRARTATSTAVANAYSRRREAPSRTSAATASTFLAGGTFETPSALTVEYLVVAGGGGGGSGDGAGGGAGGLLTGSQALGAAAYPVVVGGGGAGAGTGELGTTSANGSDSTFAGLTAIGGGRGGQEDNFGGAGPKNLGGNGGSGGGFGGANPPTNGAAGQGTRVRFRRRCAAPQPLRHGRRRRRRRRGRRRFEQNAGGAGGVGLESAISGLRRTTRAAAAVRAAGW